MKERTSATFYTPLWKAVKRIVGKMNAEEIEEAEIMVERLKARVAERKEALKKDRRTK